MAKSSLQAVLDRQKVAAAAPAAPENVEAPEPAAKQVAVAHGAVAKATRPVRVGTKFVGGHFAPAVAKQIRLLAAEEETTTQALLEEALDLLFVKKGKGRIMSVGS